MIDRFTAALSRGLAPLYLAVAALTAWEVAARYAFRAPSVWAHEIVVAVCAGLFLFGGAEAMRLDRHMRVSLIDGDSPPWSRGLSALATLLAAGAFLAALLWGTWDQFASGAFRFRNGVWRPETTGRAWDAPLPVFLRGAMLAALALTLVQTLATQGRAIGRAFGR